MPDLSESFKQSKKMNVLRLLILVVFSVKVISSEPYSDGSSTCQGLQINQFYQLISSYFQGMPDNFVVNKQAFINDITRQLEGTGSAQTSAVGFPGGSSAQLQTLIDQYLVSSSRERLVIIAALSLLHQEISLPLKITQDIEQQGITSSRQFLQQLIIIYASEPSANLLFKIVELLQLYPDYPIDATILTDIISLLTQLIAEATSNPRPVIFAYIAKFARFFSQVLLPSNIIEYLIENQLIDSSTGKVLYQQLLTEASMNATPLLLQEVYKISQIYTDVKIPFTVASALEQFGFSRNENINQGQLSSLPTSANAVVDLVESYYQSHSPLTLQQIYISSIVYPGVNIPTEIIQLISQQGIDNSIDTLRKLIDLYPRQPSSQVLTKIVELTRTFQNYPLPRNLTRDIVALLKQLISQGLSNPTPAIYGSIAKFDNYYGQVEMPTSIVVYMITHNLVSVPVGEMLYRNILAQASAGPTSALLQAIFTIAPYYRNVEIPAVILSLLYNAGFISSPDALPGVSSSPSVPLSSGQTSSAVSIQQLVLSYYQFQSQDILEEIYMYNVEYPGSYIPNDILMIMQQQRIGTSITIMRRLVDLYGRKPSRSTIILIVELTSLYPDFPLPDTLRAAIIALLNQLIAEVMSSPTHATYVTISKFYGFFDQVNMPTSIVVYMITHNLLSVTVGEMLYRELLAQAAVRPTSALLQAIYTIAPFYREVQVPAVILTLLSRSGLNGSPDVSSSVALPFSSGQASSSASIQQLVQSYYQLQSPQILEQMYIYSVEYPDSFIPNDILMAMQQQRIGTSITILRQLVALYGRKPSRSTLILIVELASLYSDFPLPDILRADIFALLNQLIAEVMSSPTPDTYVTISKFYGFFDQVNMPTSIVVYMITHNLVSVTVGEMLYRNILAQASAGPTSALLQAIFTIAPYYQNVEIPAVILSLLYNAGFISSPDALPGASSSPSVPLSSGQPSSAVSIQQLVQSYYQFQSQDILEGIYMYNVEYPGSYIPNDILMIMQQQRIGTSVTIMRRLVDLYGRKPSRSTLILIVELTSLYPEFRLPDTVRAAIIALLNQLIAEVMSSPMHATYVTIAKFAQFFDYVTMPHSIMQYLILNKLITPMQGKVMYRQLLSEASLHPTLQLMTEVTQIAQMYPDVRMPNSVSQALAKFGLANGNSVTARQRLSSPSNQPLTFIEELIKSYYESPSEEILLQILINSVLNDNFFVPHDITLAIRQKGLDSNINILQELSNLYLQEPSTVLLLKIAEYFKVTEGYTLPEPVVSGIISLINSLSQEIVTSPKLDTLKDLAKLDQFFLQANTIPEVVISYLLERNLITAPQGQSVYEKLLTDVIQTPTTIALEGVIDYSELFQNVTIPSQVIDLLFVFGLINDLSGYSTSLSNYPFSSSFSDMLAEYSQSPSTQQLEQIVVSSFLHSNVVIPDEIADAIKEQQLDSTANILRLLSELYMSQPTNVLLFKITELYHEVPDYQLPGRIISEVMTLIGQLISQALSDHQPFVVERISQLVNNFFSVDTFLQWLNEGKLKVSPELIKQMFDLSKLMPSFNWSDYFTALVTSSQSDSALTEIGKLFSTYWLPLPELLISQMLEENLVVGTPDSELLLFNYLLQNFPLTESPYILATLSYLYEIYPDTQLPQSVLNQLTLFGLINNPEKESVTASIQSIFDKIELDESMININDIALIDLTELYLTYTKSITEIVLVTQERGDQLRTLVEDVTSRIVDAGINSYLGLHSTLKDIVNQELGWTSEASTLITGNENLLATVSNGIARSLDMDTLGEASRKALIDLGKSAGATDAIVRAYNSEDLDVTPINNIIQNYMQQEKATESVANVYDSLSPLRNTSELEANDILGITMTSWVNTLDSIVLMARERNVQLQALVDDMLTQSVQSGMKPLLAVNALLNNVMSQELYLGNEASSLASANRNVLATTPMELNAFSGNSRKTMMDLGQMYGVAEALVRAYNSGGLNIVSIGNIRLIYELFEDSQDSIAPINSLYSDLLLIVDSEVTNTQALTSNVRQVAINFADSLISQNKEQLRNLTILVDDIIQKSPRAIQQLLNNIIPFLVASLEETANRYQANKDLWSSLSDGGYQFSGEQETSYRGNIEYNVPLLGKIGGITNAIVAAYNAGQFSFSNIRNIVKSVMSMEAAIEPIESLYSTLQDLATVSPQSVLQFTFTSLLAGLGVSGDYVTSTVDINEAATLLSFSGSGENVVASSTDLIIPQTMLALFLPQDIVELMKPVRLAENDFNESSSIVNDLVNKMNGSTVASSRLVVSLLREVVLTMSNLLEEATTQVTENSNFVSSAVSRRFLVSKSELVRFLENDGKVSVALGKVRGAAKALSQAYSTGNVSSATVFDILTYLSNAFTGLSFEIESEPITQFITQSQLLIIQYLNNPSIVILEQLNEIINQYPEMPIPQDILQEMYRSGLRSSSSAASSSLTLLSIEEIRQITVLSQETISLYSELLTSSSSQQLTSTILSQQIEMIWQTMLQGQLRTSNMLFVKARSTIRKLIANVRASGHPLHRAELDAFTAVTRLITSLTKQAQQVSVRLEQFATAGSLTIQQQNEIMQTSSLFEFILGEANGVRLAILDVVKALSIKILEAAEKDMIDAEKKKNDMLMSLQTIMSHQREIH